MRKIDWIDVLLIIFGLFMAYQLFLKIIGGSWQAEAVIIGLLFLNLSITWKLAMKFEGHIAWHKARDEN